MKYLYIAWAVIVFAIVFMKGGFGAYNLTRLAIIAFLLVTFAQYWKFGRGKAVSNPKLYFIAVSTLFAAVVEGIYMFTEPVLINLRVNVTMPPAQMLHNYLIDLAFTVPSYLIIFSLLWWLANRYKYSASEFIVLSALGQALGDGNNTFLYNWTLLAFLPYVMLNYHAMTLVPYLKIQNSLRSDRLQSRWRFVVPIVAVPITYFICGSLIKLAAAALHL